MNWPMKTTGLMPILYIGTEAMSTLLAVLTFSGIVQTNHGHLSQHGPQLTVAQTPNLYTSPPFLLLYVGLLLLPPDGVNLTPPALSPPSLQRRNTRQITKTSSINSNPRLTNTFSCNSPPTIFVHLVMGLYQVKLVNILHAVTKYL